MPRISQRGESMPASPIRKLVPLSNEAKAKGIKVYHLNIGQPDLPSPAEGLEALKHIDRTTLEYSPSEGLLSLRRKLQQYYKSFDINVDVDDIIVTTGGSEAVLFAFMACLDCSTAQVLPRRRNHRARAGVRQLYGIRYFGRCKDCHRSFYHRRGLRIATGVEIRGTYYGAHQRYPHLQSQQPYRVSVYPEGDEPDTRSREEA